MSTRYTVTATVNYKDGSSKFVNWTWTGRKVKPHLDKIRATYKEQGAVSVSFGMPIPVHSYGAH